MTNYKIYDDNRVLNQISLSIKEGEIHGLVGENGAGKSTLMNILFGIQLSIQQADLKVKYLLMEIPLFQSLLKLL